jgi:glucose-1-phosphate thymidylyltransferase
MEVRKALVMVDDVGDSPWPAPPRRGGGALLPVANKPILAHTLDALGAAGVSDVALLVPPTAEYEIRSLVGDGAGWGLNASYHSHPESAGAVQALQSAAELAGDEPVMVHTCDVVLREGIQQLKERFAAERWDALAMQVVGSGVRGADFAAARSRSLGQASGWLLGPAALRALRRATGSPDVGHAVARFRHGGGRVGVVGVDGCAPLADGRDGYLNANRFVLERVRADYGESSLIDSQVEGAVMIHPSAQVVGTLVRGPAVIGPRARLKDAYVGPFTSLGAGVHLEGSEIEHSVVLDGAHIAFVGTRLEGSVIGRGARVHRHFELPRATRLSVGDHAEVAFC